MALIRYTVTEVRKIEVAAGTADEALAVARAQDEGAWTGHRVEVDYQGSALFSELPGNEEAAKDNSWNDVPPSLDEDAP